MRYGMAIDLRRCSGCQTCSTSCKLANNLPIDAFYCLVHTKPGLDDASMRQEQFQDTAYGTYPDDLSRVHVPMSCQHCSKPACVDVCPTGASHVDEGTGIVLVDSQACIGCLSCVSACPYDVRVHYEGEPSYTLGFAVGEKDAPMHYADTVEKCTFCKNRLDRGQEPKCVESCSARARYFGDLDDPDSEVSRLVASRDAQRVYASAGTEPNVYYLV